MNLYSALYISPLTLKHSAVARVQQGDYIVFCFLLKFLIFGDSHLEKSLWQICLICVSSLITYYVVTTVLFAKWHMNVYN